MRSQFHHIPDGSVKKCKTATNKFKLPRTVSDGAKRKAFMYATSCMLRSMALSCLPGINLKYARRLRLNGVDSVSVLMYKMSEIKDDFCFRNWLVRVSGLPYSEANIVHDSLKDWVKLNTSSPPGVMDDVYDDEGGISNSQHQHCHHDDAVFCTHQTSHQHRLLNDSMQDTGEIYQWMNWLYGWAKERLVQRTWSQKVSGRGTYYENRNFGV